MRRFYFVPLLAAFMAVGCDDDNPTQPSEITPTFQMNLLASNETPAPIVAPDPEASCAGSVTIRINITRDASNTITAATFDFQASITGCPNSTQITLAHIHEQVAGQTGSVVVNTGVGSEITVNLVNGAGSFTANGRTPQSSVGLAVVQRILDNPAGFYFNIHSSLHGGGVIRAQLVRTQ